jgi:hypothetical protein
MRRKDDAQHEVEGVAKRLRKERPEASPLQLDSIKTAAMARTRAAGRGRMGTRRLAVLGLTLGLLAATTGGVIAGQGSGSEGDAAVAQYGNNCDTNNNNGPIGSFNHGEDNENGNESGNGNNNFNCNENSFNHTTNNYNYAGSTTTVTNNYTTVSAAGTPAGAVLGSKTSKKATSSRRIKIHVKVPHGSKLRKVVIVVNGKRVKTLLGKQASANVELVKLPCSTGATTVQITITLSDGKTVTARHSYRLCAA